MQISVINGLFIQVSTESNPISTGDNHGFIAFQVEQFRDTPYFDSIHVGPNFGYLNFRFESNDEDVSKIIPLLNPTAIAKLIKSEWGHTNDISAYRVYFLENIGLSRCLKSAAGIDQRSGQNVAVYS